MYLQYILLKVMVSEIGFSVNRARYGFQDHTVSLFMIKKEKSLLSETQVKLHFQS